MAIDCLERSVDTDPYNLEALLALGQYLLQELSLQDILTYCVYKICSLTDHYNLEALLALGQWIEQKRSTIGY